MIPFRTRFFQVIAFAFIHCCALAQCPSFSGFNVSGNGAFMCEGDMLTVSLDGQNIPPGSFVEFYIGNGTFNPYEGEGDLMGTVPVVLDDCNNEPEVLYVMVNPDNTQVGGSGDKCDEFMVIWTGSGGFSTSDIVVSNLSNGSFQWNNFIAGNEATFSCGTALPPGPVPPNAILIIQGGQVNNVLINSDALCATGLPVYIISHNNIDCTGGWFDNDFPCASCPVEIDISGADCAYSFDVDYNPPVTSTNGWGWSNMGSGVFANVIPPVDIPDWINSPNTIPNFTWTVPSDFCEEYGEGGWVATGIINPPPVSPCAEIFTPYFDVPVSCPSVNLSGGGDVCEGNCPEDPNEIIFTVSGNDLPLIVDLEITATVFPPYNIDDLEISNGSQLFICLDGIFPSFDPTTNTLTIPTLAIGLSATVEIISIESASGCNVQVSSNTITLNFIEAPTADAGPDKTICSFEQVTLNGSIGGSATNAMWSTSGDGVFANPSDPSTAYAPGPDDIANETVTVTLTATDPNGACIPAVSSAVISIEPSMNIDVGPPITICNTDIANISAMVSGPVSPGIWETDGDGTFGDPNDLITFYEPGEDDLDNGFVSLFYIPVDPNACFEGNYELEIDIVDAPIVNVPQNIEVCSEDSITIHINVSGNFTDIIWTTSGDGVITLITDTEINYEPGPGDINDQFAIVSVTVVSGFPECGQTTYNMPIEIVLCDCDPFQTSPPPAPLCNQSDTIDLNTLFVEGGAGVWSISATPPGSNPAVLNGDLFIVSNSDAGSYTVTYTLDIPEDGCPPASNETIIVTANVIPEAGANIANCGPALVFVNGTVIPSGSATIFWETLGDGSFVNASSLATSYIPGTLDSNSNQIPLVLHLVDPVCGDKTDTTYVLFPEPPLTVFSNDTVVVCNEVEKGSVLDFAALIISGDNAGVWTNTGGVPVDFSNPSNVNFDGIAAGYYAFSYQTNSAMFPCQEVTYTIVVEVEDCSCPLLEFQSPPSGICNSLDKVNMAAFITAGGPGTWQVVGAPPGSNPAFFIGSELQTSGVDAGTYRVRFTFDAAPIFGCPDSAEIDITIQEFPIIIAGSDISTCGLEEIQLNAQIGGSATGVSWSTSGSGDFNDPSILNPLYSPSVNDLNSASISFYTITVDTFGFCNPSLDTIQVMLVHPPSTSWSSLMTSVCNNPDSGSIVNLPSFISGGDGTGIWTDVDLSGVDLSDPSAVDFDGIAPGNYIFSYLTQTAVSPCVDSTYIFTIRVDDCSCPVIDIQNIDNPICIPQNVDLNALITDVPPGTWVVANGPAGNTFPVITGSNVVTTNADPGIYNLNYILTDSIPGCPASKIIPLELESVPSVTFGAADCDEISMTYSISFSSDASSVTVDVGTIVETSPGNYTIESVPAGVDISIDVASASGRCSDSFLFQGPDCACTLVTEDISDTILLCPGDTFVLIPFLTGAQGLAFSTWISDEVTLMRPTLPLYEANTWIWIVRDSAGCEQIDTFNVALRELINVDASSVSPSCEGQTDGLIILHDIDGGVGPYTVQLDNQQPFISNTWPDTLSNVGVGNHTLTVTNMDGCETYFDLTLNAAMNGSIDLGPDESVKLGDSILITPVTENVTVASSQWDPAFISSGIAPFWFTPTASTNILLTVFDSMGCIFQDEKLISVIVDQRIYIPNIFSPNGDQINDVLDVTASSLSFPISSIDIYDRWGNNLHHGASAPFTWDGISRSKEALPGVYVIRVLWKDENGNAHVIVKDFTLIR